MDCIQQTAQGLMEYREQVVVFRKDDINHIARIIIYVDIKKGKRPKLISLLTNLFDKPNEQRQSREDLSDAMARKGRI